MEPRQAGTTVTGAPGRRLARTARRSVRTVVARGSEDYERERHLPRLIPVGPADIADESTAGRRAILAKLSRALRAERWRGRAGHWTYDLNRHLGLCQAYAAERRMLGREQRGAENGSAGQIGRRSPEYRGGA